MIDFEQWEGFEGRIWKEEVNVRDFIQKNYTPYDGDESFLAGPTEATDKLWGALQKLQKAERAKGGVLDMETEVVSGLTAYGPGYIDESLKEFEQIVGLQTDKPLKRAFMPYGGIKMAEQADVPYMVKSNVASGGSYNYAAACGIPSVLIERGQMGSWSPEEVHSTRKDVRNILCALGVYDGMRSYSNYYPMEIEDVRYQSASVSGLWYPAKKPGDIIKVGEYLGCVKDYEGNILETSLSDLNGVVLYQTGSLQVIKDGPMIAYGSFSRRKDERKKKITNYWAKRSDSFMEQRRAELHSDMADKWLKEIGTFLPDGKLRILDVGCGAGFFSILLAKLGHEVTGIDLTPDMIIHSRELAKEENVSCTFEVMDAENPDFPDGTFDVIVSRNLTWTLPDAARAYKEWIRVLKTGGILINADANYGADDFSDTADLPANHAHFTVGDAMMQECEEIKRQLPISSYVRPAWDLETLGKLGINRFSIDLGISSRIYTKKDEFYNPTPMFLICGEKNKCNN